MEKLIRRVSPRHPAVGVALAVLILAEAGALANMYELGYGKAHEGGWSKSREGGLFPACIYHHEPDTFEDIPNSSTKVWRRENSHATNCWVEMNERFPCDNDPHVYMAGNRLHCGPVDQDHISEGK